MDGVCTGSGDLLVARGGNASPPIRAPYFSIPPNTFGPGLAIVHYGPIVVNGNARTGANCRTHVCVNIGGIGGLVDAQTARRLAPILGNNVYIGPGAKIFGPVRTADRCAIGANAVVNTSFEVPGCSIAGVLAWVISNKGSAGMIVPADGTGETHGTGR